MLASMRIYKLNCAMLTEKSIDETFAVFEDPYNLAKITPPWLSFLVTSKDHVTMRKGAEIQYRIRWLGLPLHWKTLITDYEPPFWFVDEQASGPYSLWRHHHTFAPSADGTLVQDEVQYALPLGPLGVAAHRLLIGRQLIGIFQFRQRALKVLLGGNAKQTRPPVITCST